MATYLTNDEWAKMKDYDYFIAYEVTCLAAASITTGWYFTYNNGSVHYYVWMDKNGDGVTDDPGPIGSKTSLPVDISGATTATQVATALASAVDAVAGSSADSTAAVVTITNASNENSSSLVDVDTTFTISKLGYAAKEPYPKAETLTLYRRRIYANMNRWIPGGSADTSTYGDALLDMEYRGVELMIDEEQGRSTEEGRPIYIPRDYLFERDRQALAGMGASGFTRGIGS